MRVFITGSAGFIGSHLAYALSRNGMEVLGIDNLDDYYDVRLKIDRLKYSGFNFSDSVSDSGKELSIDSSYPLPIEDRIYKSELFPDLRFIRTDIRSRHTDDIIREFSPDIIVHLAAQPGIRYSVAHPEESFHNNAGSFLRLLEICRENSIGRMLYASSSSVYGDASPHAFRETDRIDCPKSIYAIAKRSNEMMANLYAELYGMKIIGMRFFSVYGEWGRPDMAPYVFTDALVNDRTIPLFNAGRLSRDFTYIGDVIECIRRIIDGNNLPDTQGYHEILNIGHGTPTMVTELLEMLEKIIGKKGHTTMLPKQPGEMWITLSDCTKLRIQYGYHPATPLEEGLKKFVDWYMDYYNEKKHTNENRINYRRDRSGWFVFS